MVEEAKTKQNNTFQHNDWLEGKMIRNNEYVTIKELHNRGMSKKLIARTLSLNIKTVRKHLQKDSWSSYNRTKKAKGNLLTKFTQFLLNRMSEVNYNASILFRELKLMGYQGSYETIKSFIHPYRKGGVVRNV